MAKTITCPYCFNTFPVNQAQFRCTNSQCANSGKVFDAPPVKRRLFSQPPVITSAECPTCLQPSYKRLCPHCNFELTHDAGLTDEVTIAVIGGRGTGKSTYIATLIHRLKNEVGLNFQAGVGALNDYTRRRYRDDFEVPLFRKRQLLPPTRTASQEASTKTPMVFRITFEKNAANLSIFDSAGEDMQSLDTMSLEARYICHADGVVFLLDPLQIDTVRQLLAGGDVPLPLPDAGAEPKLIVERLRQLYERQLGLRSTTKIDKPVAFTLAKIDALYSILEPGSGLHSNGGHFGFFNAADAQSIHTEITHILMNWMGPEFDNFLRANFSHYRYFGVSSLGQPPRDPQHLETVAPHRVEDPILWLFHEFGVVKGKK